MIDYFSVLFKILSSFLSDLFEKYLEYFLRTPWYLRYRIYFLYTVDTEGGDGAANFTELGSDYSEPGKHVWTFDMMSVLACFAFS